MAEIPTTMPWSGIAKATAAFAVLLTAACAVGVADERARIAEANRPRWTDKNRWE